MSTNEEVIMTVKLWGVDRFHLRFDYHSESNSLSFFSFLFKMLFISLFFIYETFPHSCIFFVLFCLQADTLFFLLMFCMFSKAVTMS